MKYFESILAFGDSHVAGCELSDETSLLDYTSGNITIEQADAPGKQLAFPQLIANKLTIPCYNYAMTGGSNARSLRLLQNAVQQHPNSLVLFGYTCTDRTEFYYPDAGNFLGRDADNFIQVGMQWEGAVKKAGMKHPINDTYVKKLLRSYNNLSQVAFYVDNICTLYAKDFLHLPLFPEEFPNVDNVFNYQGQTNYLDWCNAQGFKQLPFLHYGQGAHQALADLILRDLYA
jgi:hypothetical protein